MMKVEYRFIWTLVIGVGLSILAVYMISSGLTRYSSHRYPRLSEIFVKKTAHDVIFIGSSRTHTTIYPRIIDSITGLSTYNAGVEGGAMFEFKMTIDGYLVNHPSPKMIVLTIDPFSLDLAHRMFDPTQYLPFIDRNQFIEEGFIEMESQDLSLQQLPFLRQLIYVDDYVKGNALKGWMGKTEVKPGEFDNKGFMSNGKKCIDTTQEVTPMGRNDQINAKAIDLLKQVIDTCKKRDIRLMLTYAPEYRHKYKKHFNNFGSFEETVSRIARTNNLQFYRDDSLAMNTEPCLFLNYGHPNTAGAIEYSKILGLRIKNLLQTNLRLAANDN